MIVVAGPTASGKSSLALDVAQCLNGVVINADSMQIYRDVPTLTARPKSADEEKAEHRLYGFLEPQETYSVFQWVQSAAREIKRAWAKGKVPVVVGGTGFYIQTLIKGISAVPQTKDDIRRQIREELETLGYEKFLKEFQRKDPLFSFTDPQRVLRAAEVLRQTGQSITYWQSLPFQKEVEADFFTILMDLPRAVLYERCNERFGLMLRGTAVEEVRELFSKNPPADSPILKALGVMEIKDCLDGRISQEEATEHACQMTRNYAKRQMTWFRHRFEADDVVNDVKSADILTKALHFLE